MKKVDKLEALVIFTGLRLVTKLRMNLSHRLDFTNWLPMGANEKGDGH